MRVTVKIEDVEVTVDRPNFENNPHQERRELQMKDSVLPTLEAATAKAIELHKQKQQSV